MAKKIMKAIFSKDVEVLVNELRPHEWVKIDYFAIKRRVTTYKVLGLPIYVRTELFVPDKHGV
jgi:hypothetical protein